MKTYNKIQDYKNRLKLAVIILLIGSVAMWLTSCSDSAKEEDKSDKPPFTEFWFSVKVESDNPGTSNFSKVDYYNVWGSMYDGSKPKTDYQYKTTQSDKLPDNCTLTLQQSGDVFGFTATGVLKREGTSIPVDYHGNESLWDDTECYYEISINANRSTSEITTASMRIYNSKFNASYDIVKHMEFTIADDGIRFSNSHDDSADDHLTYFRVSLQIEKL